MGYSETVTGRPTIQWQNEKGKTREQTRVSHFQCSPQNGLLNI
jgi:single-stranded DNA-binding protein